MGKALYRSYRPKKLDEVVGQEHITDTLANALKKGAVSHAYLFTGPKGVGKTSIARILAHAINDLEYTDEATHLDIIEIDAASNRRIDEIREIRDKVNIAPSVSKYKIYIIDEVHMLTREAFNALLKTLEEPPAHVVFILATTEAHKVPDTILSRTQRFTFKPVERTKIVEHLRTIAQKEGIDIDDEALGLLADHGNGSFRDSISMLDQLAGIIHDETINITDVQQLLGMPPEDLINNIISALSKKNIRTLFDSVQKLNESGVDSGKAAQSLSATLREHLLNENTEVIEPTTAIKALKSILPLTTKSQDFLGLEIALIDAIYTDSVSAVPKKQITHSPPKSASDSSVEDTVVERSPAATVEAKSATTEKSPEAHKANQSDAPASEAIVKTMPFDEKSWKELLHALKQKHNTLYGVLRMADAKIINGKLTLEFGFAFHKKQVDSPKNTTIVREYILTYFGINDFEAKVVARQTIDKPTKPKPKNEPNNEIIASVSNIFGGAELLES